MLKGFLDDSPSWRTDLEDLYFKFSGPWADALDNYWSEKKVVREAFYIPDIKEGSQRPSALNKKTKDHYPFPWQVMQLYN